jgi:hypothetical protein
MSTSASAPTCRMPSASAPDSSDFRRLVSGTTTWADRVCSRSGTRSPRDEGCSYRRRSSSTRRANKPRAIARHDGRARSFSARPPSTWQSISIRIDQRIDMRAENEVDIRAGDDRSERHPLHDGRRDHGVSGRRSGTGVPGSSWENRTPAARAARARWATARSGSGARSGARASST